MAYVAPVKDKDGVPTSYRVKWREGGGRDDPWQGENFEDETAAGVFKDLVNAAGQHWPEGWVKGRGFVSEEEETEDERCNFRAYALASIARRTGAEERYRRASVKEAETYLFPTFGDADVRSTKDFSKATIADWLTQMSQTMVWRGGEHRKMSPKTIKNLHGLLSSILKEAAEEEPPLRARNPCDSSRLPRADDDGLEDEGEDEDKYFLTPAEIEAIVAELTRPEDKLLVRFAYATGLRWGELSALAKRHIFRDPKDGKVKVRVTRAWKRHPDDGYYIGKPKSKASRRTIRLAETIWQELVEAGLLRLAAGALVFHNGRGDRLPYSTFYDRWIAAVSKAKEKWPSPEEMELKLHEFERSGSRGHVTLPGLDPEKYPGIHDIRHSTAGALLSEGRALTYVQRFLGHESIETTSDTYGHLLPQADDDAMDTLERALGGGRGPADSEAGAVPEQRDGRQVWAVQAGAVLIGFWTEEHARDVAAQWGLDKGRAAEVLPYTAAWWTRTVAGGLTAVCRSVPDRVQVWSVGPAVYAGDGTEHLRSAGYEPVAVWRWDWEEGYTDEPALPRAEWRPSGLTEAEAWGTDRDAVLEAFAEARADALRICSLNPALGAGDGREAEV
ncbi:tyrosine-type recombinase/integrase [Kitasatospora sp. NPDC058046]|uniref:tyrosine-type recombinase/integrase n=1 Tax=Kitasatospora sp. NPDC058046 TaxID=3346312 RepID=UPI0036D7B7B7